MWPVFCLSLCSSPANIPRWRLIPFVYPSPALSLRRRRVAWAQWWCPTSCPPPCAACPLSQPSPTPPQASPAAPRPPTGPPAFPPRSQSLHLFYVFVFVFLSCLYHGDRSLQTLILSVLKSKALLVWLYVPISTSDCSHAVPCCPVPPIAGPLFCPAQKRTIGSPEKTGRNGAWANPRSYWSDSQTQMRYNFNVQQLFFIHIFIQLFSVQYLDWWLYKLKLGDLIFHPNNILLFYSCELGIAPFLFYMNIFAFYLNPDASGEGAKAQEFTYSRPTRHPHPVSGRFIPVQPSEPTACLSTHTTDTT